MVSGDCEGPDSLSIYTTLLSLLWSVEVSSLHAGCIVTSKEISLDCLSFRAWISALVEQTGVSLAGESSYGRKGGKETGSSETANKVT